MIFRDISLQQFGRLTASFPLGLRGRFLYWACLCDCGNTAVVCFYNLRAGTTQSCGCIQRELLQSRNISPSQRLASTKHMTWLHSNPDFRPAFKHGHSKGSLGRNHIQSSTYGSWVNMIDRCTRPKNPEWHCYGGANPPVVICDRWRNSFEAFLEDMGEKPIEPVNLSLSRFGDINNYSCGHCEQCRQNGWELNCAWHTPKQQGIEKRIHHQLNFLVAA